MLLVSDFAELDALLLPHNFARLELSLAAFGCGWAGALLLALDFAQAGSLTSPQSSSHLGAALLVLDFSTLGLSPSPHNHVRLGSPTSLIGLSCPGSVFALSVVSSALLGFSVPAQSSS